MWSCSYKRALLKVRGLETKAGMAFVSLQGGNRYKRKTAQTSTNFSRHTDNQSALIRKWDVLSWLDSYFCW